jgi:hypothetical protein
MYDPIVCQRAPARGPKATGLEPPELTALGGNNAGQHYSDPVALKFGLLGCTPMLWRAASRCASMEATLAARACSSELAWLAGLV